jgi:hypothetical protein
VTHDWNEHTWPTAQHALPHARSAAQHVPPAHTPPPSSQGEPLGHAPTSEKVGTSAAPGPSPWGASEIVPSPVAPSDAAYVGPPLPLPQPPAGAMAADAPVTVERAKTMRARRMLARLRVSGRETAATVSLVRLVGGGAPGSADHGGEDRGSTAGVQTREDRRGARVAERAVGGSSMRLASLLGAAAFLAACSGSSSGTGPAQDGGPEGAATANDAGDAAAPPHDAQGDAPPACNTLANVAQTVTVQAVAQDPPQSQGGTVADGTYALTDVTLYTGPGGPSGASGHSQVTIQIAGTTIEVVNAGNPPTQTVTLATSGTAFTATDTCPDTKVTQGSYTTTATTFVVFLDGGSGDAGARTLVETFTKQ